MNYGTPIPLDTHPPEHSSPWNTHPPGTLTPGTPIPLEHSSTPGTPIPLEHSSPPWNNHPPLIFFPCARCTYYRPQKFSKSNGRVLGNFYLPSLNFTRPQNLQICMKFIKRLNREHFYFSNKTFQILWVIGSIKVMEK